MSSKTPLHRRLRIKRLETRFTKDQVSNILAVHVDEYTKLEKGESQPSKEMLEDIAAFYNITVQTLTKDTTRFTVVEETKDE